MGVWGKPGTGPFLRGRGGSGFSPSAFPDWSPLLSVYSCSRAVVFLTSASLLFEGVRSGTRRRRGASASAQAGGGPGRKRGAQRPHARALRCTAGARLVCGGCSQPSNPADAAVRSFVQIEVALANEIYKLSECLIDINGNGRVRYVIAINSGGKRVGVE